MLGYPSPKGSTPPGKEAPPGRKHPLPLGRKHPPPGIRVNERPVRILLECILVLDDINETYVIFTNLAPVTLRKLTRYVLVKVRMQVSGKVLI